jgi:penicillin amidase
MSELVDRQVAGSAAYQELRGARIMASGTYRDAWGIPHLRASDPLRLAFAQGKNAARDRAWQIEAERHRSQGTTASFLGAAAVPWDRFVRRARLDDTARRCFEHAGGGDGGLGVGVRRRGERRPRAGSGRSAGVHGHRDSAREPWQKWTPLGVWLAHHILFAGFPTKLWREEVARRLGDDALELFAADGPGTAGSNGWLVAGDRTASGAALIAGDPHRFIQDPGFYQQIHLSCPEYDVVGFAVPGVPGIAHFGHTGTVAWAITNAMSDYHDLYRERLRTSDDGVEALGPEGWRPAAHHRETIEVAGGDPVEIDVIETDRGPVIIDGPIEGAEGAEGDSGSAAPSSKASASATRPASPRTWGSTYSRPSSVPVRSRTWTGRSTAGSSR